MSKIKISEFKLLLLRNAHFGFTNFRSQVHSFWVIAVWIRKFWSWTPCTYKKLIFLAERGYVWHYFAIIWNQILPFFLILLFSFLQCTRFVQSVCSLIQQVSLLVSSTKQTKVREEWKEFFASSIFPILLELFVVIATNTNIATEDKECVLSDLGESH